MHLHPPPRAYFLPRTIYHDGEPTTLERALRRGADPTALMVDDGMGGRKPYMRLTAPQFAFLVGLLDTYVHGSTAIVGRGAMRIASSLDARKLAGVLEATEPGEPNKVVIMNAGLDALAERRADLTCEQAARLDLALASLRRAAREIAR